MSAGDESSPQERYLQRCLLLSMTFTQLDLQQDLILTKCDQSVCHKYLLHLK